MRADTELRLRGKRNDETSLRIADLHGYIKNIHFLFDISTDSAYLVATKMVEELNLEVHDVPFIAEFIEFVVMKILPDQILSPDSAIISPNGISIVIGRGVNCSEFALKSVITSEKPSNLVVEHEVPFSTNEGGDNNLRVKSTYSTASTQSDHHRNALHSTVTYMLLEDAEKTNPVYTTYNHLCSSSTDYNAYSYGISSSTNPDSPFGKPCVNHTVHNLISCYSSLSLSEKDNSQELILELDAVESEYQLMFQELTRMKQESIEAAKSRWMTKPRRTSSNSDSQTLSAILLSNFKKPTKNSSCNPGGQNLQQQKFSCHT